MKNDHPIILLFIIFSLYFLSCGEKNRTAAREAERQEIAKVVDSCIGWFKTKDFELYFRAVAQDSNFIAVHPTDKVVIGFEQVLENSEIFKRPEFQYVRVGVVYSAIPIAGLITLLFVIEKALISPSRQTVKEEAN